jgi:molecular chaperone GrpE
MKESDLKDPYHLSRAKGKSQLKKDVKKETDIVRIPIKGKEDEDVRREGLQEQAAETVPDNQSENEAPTAQPEIAQKQELQEPSARDQEISELQERIKRLHADFENFRRRKEEEAQEAKKYASEEIIKHLLSIMDNFERALSSASDSHNFQSLLEGLQMVHRQMKDLLDREGVKEINARGEAFDPALHQAVMKVEDDSLPDETVVAELQKGYKMKDKVIRPSMVQVSRKSS